jgi:hypothetical protein
MTVGSGIFVTGQLCVFMSLNPSADVSKGGECFFNIVEYRFYVYISMYYKI